MDTRLRCFLRFRLRTLLAAVVVLSLPLGWLAHGLHRAAGQREAVASLGEVGARAYYDYELDESGALLALRKQTSGPARISALSSFPRFLTPTSPPRGVPPGDWRRPFLGDDFFDRIERVDLDGCNFHGSELARLKAFPRLRVLILNGSNVTDEDLEALAKLPRLETLNLAATEITDNGLRRLVGSPHLTSLSLRDTYVTDAGLKYLESMPALEEVFLDGAYVTNEGAAQLRGKLPQCAIDEFVAGKYGYRGSPNRRGGVGIH
jgi:hypothetical protein